MKSKDFGFSLTISNNVTFFNLGIFNCKTELHKGNVAMRFNFFGIPVAVNFKPNIVSTFVSITMGLTNVFF